MNAQDRTTIKHHFDFGKSIWANFEDLLSQAAEIKDVTGVTNHVCAMLQHLVGAKLDLILGAGKIRHRGFKVAHPSTDQSGDFHVESVAIHVTTDPTEALARKCIENLSAGLKPIIVTVSDAIEPAEYILNAFELKDRVDVLDAAQFLTGNIYEYSLFNTVQCKATLSTLLARYNEIVSECESDSSLRIMLNG